MNINPLLEQRSISNYDPLCYTNPRGGLVTTPSQKPPITVDSLSVCNTQNSDILPLDVYNSCGNLMMLQGKSRSKTENKQKS